MSILSVKSPKYLSILVFTLSLLISSSAYAQNHSNNDQLSINSFKPISDSDVSAPERPRVVVKSTDVKERDEKSKVSDTASMLLRFERQAFEILNLKRSENGLPELKWNEDMAKIARNHSTDMAEYHYFSHMSRSGLMVNDRADQLGFSNWQALGENIAYNRGYDKPVEFACEGWMKSPSHRDNILNMRWKEAGIGAAISVDGSYYFTEVFMLK